MYVAIPHVRSRSRSQTAVAGSQLELECRIWGWPDRFFPIRIFSDKLKFWGTTPSPVTALTLLLVVVENMLSTLMVTRLIIYSIYTYLQTSPCCCCSY